MTTVAETTPQRREIRWETREDERTLRRMYDCGEIKEGDILRTSDRRQLVLHVCSYNTTTRRGGITVIYRSYDYDLDNNKTIESSTYYPLGPDGLLGRYHEEVSDKFDEDLKEAGLT